MYDVAGNPVRAAQQARCLRHISVGQGGPHGGAGDPQAMYLQAAAEEATAKAAKARADTVETVASAELKRAQTIETLSKVENDDQTLAINSAKTIQEMMRNG